MHPDLKYAGVLPPLDAPHHLRSSEWGPYREGVVRSADAATGSLLDVGLELDAHVPQARERRAHAHLPPPLAYHVPACLRAGGGRCRCCSPTRV